MLLERRKLIVSAFVAGTIFIVLLGAEIALFWHTRLQLMDGETGRILLSAILRDGDKATLTWHNSLFDLDVTEDFVVESGTLVQTAVTFADPRGLPPMQIAPAEVDDFYHTGGPFTTTGLRRQFSRIVYRIGEIGNPHFMVGKQVISFKQEVSFGGQVILSTGRPRLTDLFSTDFSLGQVAIRQ